MFQYDFLVLANESVSHSQTANNSNVINNKKIVETNVNK